MRRITAKPAVREAVSSSGSGTASFGTATRKVTARTRNVVASTASTVAGPPNTISSVASGGPATVAIDPTLDSTALPAR